MFKYSATITYQNGEAFLQEASTFENLCKGIIQDIKDDMDEQFKPISYTYDKDGVEEACSDVGIEIDWHKSKSNNQGSLLLEVTDDITTDVLIESNSKMVKLSYDMTDPKSLKTEPIAIEVTGSGIKIRTSEGIFFALQLKNHWLKPMIKVDGKETVIKGTVRKMY